MIPKTKFAWLLLIGLVLISFSLIFLPASVIQPFKAQTPEKLRLSYIAREISPVITLIAFVIGLFLTTYLWWLRPRWWKKIGLVLSVVLLSLFAWFSRQNYFEWMFHPLKNPNYAKSQDANFVEKNDMVLAVQINGEAAAYPVRQLAYHHLVHDTVGGVPIVATY